MSDVITLSEKGATEAMAEDMILLAGNEVNSSKIKKKTIFAKILQKIFTVVKKISFCKKKTWNRYLLIKRLYKICVEYL